MAKRASKQGGSKVGYFIQSRGPGDRVEFEQVYVYGPTRRSDEGIVGHDLRMRPTRLGPGDYTFVASPDDVEWTKPGESKQPKSHAQIKREVDKILAGSHSGTSGKKSLYQELLAAGIPIDHHESDLYVLDTLRARALIAKHGKTASAFTSQIDGKRWLDVPFAYDPFWERRR